LGIAFQYHPDILERFPSIIGGVILARDMQNGPSPDALLTDYTVEQQAVIARIGNTPLSELPSIAAWRSGFRAFGVEPTQYRCAAEALLRRLTKKGDIPSINTLVDIGNLVSIRYGLPVAVIDTRALSGAITVHFADGTERFLPLGETEVEHPEVGEVIFSDPTGLCAARRWCWRQSDAIAARETTTDAIITIEALHDSGRADIEAAMADVISLMERYAGGTYTSGVLSIERAGFENLIP
jgi:DNA/RNA-binding domain of Phe-tRNA-synthetase-like protein